jgi:uncharacterized lipoprotein NlpE involved in copper resistance
MKRSSKLFSMLGVAAMAMLLVVGCSNSSDGGGSEDVSTAYIGNTYYVSAMAYSYTTTVTASGIDLTEQYEAIMGSLSGSSDETYTEETTESKIEFVDATTVKSYYLDEDDTTGETSWVLDDEVTSYATSGNDLTVEVDGESITVTYSPSSDSFSGSFSGTEVDDDSGVTFTVDYTEEITLERYTTEDAEESDPAESDPVESTATVYNFDDLTVGETISTADSNWYTSNLDDTTGTVAEVSDTQAYSGSNSLYIIDNRADNKPSAYTSFADGAASSGSVSFAAYVVGTNTKTFYANVGTGKNNSDRYFELRVSGSGTVEYEAGTTDVEIGSVTTDEWHTYSIEWTDAGIFNVYIDDVICDVADIDQSSTGLTTTNIPTQTTFYIGDTSGTNQAVYIDDVSSTLF